jgi:molybdate/tungstate transport system substrate-binding protein
MGVLDGRRHGAWAAHGSGARRPSPRTTRRVLGGVLGVGLAGLALVACGSGGSLARSGPARSSAAGSSTATTGAASGQPRGGLAEVAYAGSLLPLNEQTIGPAFERATGDHYQGRGGGSYGLAREIQAGEIRPTVFESIGGGPIELLEPRFTRWWVQVASSPLVLAYNPSGPDGPLFERAAAGKVPLKDVFLAMAKPGFRLGRTNPATDPQGQAFVMMIELAQRDLGLPAGIVDQILGAGARHGGGDQQQIFAETALDAHLEAGQLDAASAFLSQAVQLHLHYLRLPAAIDFGDPAEASAYAQASIVVPGSQPGSTKTVHGAPLVVDATVLDQPGTSRADRAAAWAFVAYLFSPAGRQAFERAGYQLVPPTISGPASAVPALIHRAVESAGSTSGAAG